jgi:hypothetical protein
MRRTAILLALGIALLSGALTGQPAQAELGNAGGLIGFASGAYGRGLSTIDTGAQAVDISGTFGGYAVSAGGQSMGNLHCNFSGEVNPLSTVFTEMGQAAGSCFSDLLKVGTNSDQCTLSWTRITVIEEVSFSCFFATSGDNGFTASGFGEFEWAPTGFVGTDVRSFYIVGVGTAVL